MTGNTADTRPGPATTRCLRRMADGCDALARAWLSAAVLGMAALLVAQVFFRYALNHSLFWSEELGRALLVQLTFVGASVAWRGRAHIGMDAVTARLSPLAARRVRLLVLCVCLAFFMAVAWHGVRFTLFLLPQQTVTLGVSRAVIFAAVPVGAAMLALHALSDLAAVVLGSERAGPAGPTERARQARQARQDVQSGQDAPARNGGDR